MFTQQRLLGVSEHERPNTLALLDQCSKKLLDGVRIATALEQRRNQLIHSQWLTSPEMVNRPGTIMRMKAKTKNGNSMVSFDDESIEDIDLATSNAKKAQLLITEALAAYQEIAQNHYIPRNAA